MKATSFTTRSIRFGFEIALTAAFSMIRLSDIGDEHSMAASALVALSTCPKTMQRSPCLERGLVEPPPLTCRSLPTPACRGMLQQPEHNF
jgi:hypothetical protein